MRTYRGFDTDNARWDGFEFRDGDIIISAPMKAGTTWTQMLCALLIFGTDDLPAPLSEISPWFDMLSRPLEDVSAQVAAQNHRRFLKTHTPLDGLPIDDRVTYVGVGRHPLDLAVSAAHHSANLDFEAAFAAISAVIGVEEAISRLQGRPIPAQEPADRLHFYITADEPPQRALTLGSVMDHYATFFASDRTIVRLHYSDLQRDREGEMRRLAAALGIEIPEPQWPRLVAAADFAAMKSNAGQLVPGADLGLFKDPGRFFRSAAAGEWKPLLDDAGRARYRDRLAARCDPAVVAWAEHGRQAAS